MPEVRRLNSGVTGLGLPEPLPAVVPTEAANGHHPRTEALIKQLAHARQVRKEKRAARVAQGLPAQEPYQRKPKVTRVAETCADGVIVGLHGPTDVPPPEPHPGEGAGRELRTGELRAGGNTPDSPSLLGEKQVKILADVTTAIVHVTCPGCTYRFRVTVGATVEER